MAVGLGRVFEIMDLEPDIRDRHGASVLAPLAEAVTFDDVSFSYIAGKPVLNGISARATAGTITAIIGPTGTGKSTLMSLLLRLADVDEGRIAIDGTDIRDLTIASQRACISIAMQENILFSDTVCENIRYAAPNANLADVIAAARVACADEFVGELPDGYDTPFGERASRLSTGQRQRLVLARAIVRDTPILILDEPTSALDARTELTVLSNLKDWGKPQGLRRGTLHFSDYASAVDYSPRQPGHLPD
jgi:ABC-type multidrug transport system fused ATPase/permease subunit